jgi:hypothetical protein
MIRRFSTGSPFSLLSNVSSLNSDLGLSCVPITFSVLAGATWSKAKEPGERRRRRLGKKYILGTKINRDPCELNMKYWLLSPHSLIKIKDHDKNSHFSPLNCSNLKIVENSYFLDCWCRLYDNLYYIY